MHDVVPRSARIFARSAFAHAQADGSAALVILVGMTQLLAEAGGLDALRPVARASVLLWLALNLRRMQRLEWIFLAAATAAALLVAAVAPDPVTTLLKGLDQAGLFLTFVATLNLLRDAAHSSVAVRRGGRYLIAQSPPRRYVALTLGGHLFAIALNMGALNLLGAMVRKSNTMAAAGGDPVIVAIRERRMIGALSRGFAATLLWTPMGVSVAYTLSFVPGVTWFDLAPPTLLLACSWLVIGWIVDRLAWPPSLRRAALPPPVPVSPRELVPVIAVTSLLLLGVIATKLVMRSSLLVAVMSTVPFMATLWIALQYRRAGPRRALAAAGRRLIRHLRGHLPQVRPEAVVLACGSFVGVAMGTLAASSGFERALAGLALPPALLVTGVFFLIFLPAQVGITPLVTTAVVGTALGQMSTSMVPPLALALSMQSAWSLSSCTSPFSGGALLLARIIGKSPFILQHWNASFAAACCGLMVAIFAVWLL